MRTGFTVDDVHYILSEVSANQIQPYCFIADPVFANKYKNSTTNRLNKFVSPNEDTRNSVLQYTFSDLICEDAKFKNAQKQFDRLIDSYSGILITSFSPNWLQLAHEIKNNKQKHVYFSDIMNPNNIYLMYKF